MSAVNPEESEAAGFAFTVIVIGLETAVQLFVPVTSTVIWSPVTRSDLVNVFVVEDAPKLTPFLKNSYTKPPEAVKFTASPEQELAFPTNVAVGVGSTVT